MRRISLGFEGGLLTFCAALIFLLSLGIYLSVPNYAEKEDTKITSVEGGSKVKETAEVVSQGQQADVSADLTANTNDTQKVEKDVAIAEAPAPDAIPASTNLTSIMGNEWVAPLHSACHPEEGGFALVDPMEFIFGLTDANGVYALANGKKICTSFAGFLVSSFIDGKEVFEDNDSFFACLVETSEDRAAKSAFYDVRGVISVVGDLVGSSPTSEGLILMKNCRLEEPELMKFD